MEREKLSILSSFKTPKDRTIPLKNKKSQNIIWRFWIFPENPQVILSFSRKKQLIFTLIHPKREKNIEGLRISILPSIENAGTVLRLLINPQYCFLFYAFFNFYGQVEESYQYKLKKQKRNHKK